MPQCLLVVDSSLPSGRWTWQRSVRSAVRTVRRDVARLAVLRDRESWSDPRDSARCRRARDSCFSCVFGPSLSICVYTNLCTLSVTYKSAILVFEKKSHKECNLKNRSNHLPNQVIRFDLHGKTYCVWLTNEGVSLFISPLIYPRKTKIALFYETKGVHVLYTYMGLGRRRSHLVAHA
jgi:hypothetical protein